MKPVVSIIIVNWNGLTHLSDCLASLESQTFHDFELIVVDDGSTDNTHLIEDQYDGQLLYIKQENKGVSAARNRGIRKSIAKYIAFLDSDDKWLPSKLEEHHRFIIKNPDIRIHQTDEIWIRRGQRVNPKNKHKKKGGDIFTKSLELCLISPSAVVLNRNLFDEFGYFDESMPVCEDYDLWLRITSRERIGLIDKKLVEKFGGHHDQLSNRYWGMDRFRIYSIIKLLKEQGNELGEKNKEVAKKTALKKCRILATGALKRKKIDYANQIKEIILMLNNENYSSIDYRILLGK